MKTESLRPKNHPRNPVLRLTLKSSMCIDYCWLRNRLPKLGLGTQKSSKKASSTAKADIFYAHRLLLPQKPLMKTESLLSQKYPRHLVLRLTLKSSMYIEYCWLRDCLWNLGPWDPKIIQEAQFYGWRWHLLRTLTTADWETIAENWVPPVPKIILETLFYGWRWNLQCAYTIAGSETVYQN